MQIIQNWLSGADSTVCRPYERRTRHHRLLCRSQSWASPWIDESQQTEAKKFLGLGNIVVLDLHYILSGLITLHSYKATNLWWSPWPLVNVKLVRALTFSGIWRTELSQLYQIFCKIEIPENKCYSYCDRLRQQQYPRSTVQGLTFSYCKCKPLCLLFCYSCSSVSDSECYFFISYFLIGLPKLTINLPINR